VVQGYCARNFDIYIPWIGYDDYSAEYFVQDLREEFGAECPEKVQQGAKTLAGPLRSLGADLEAKRINYGNNPITKWCLSTVAVTEDRNANLLPCKTSNTRRRRDGFAAMLDAICGAGEAPGRICEFDLRCIYVDTL
jgi:phage terminase large subunit-like protein